MKTTLGHELKALNAKDSGPRIKRMTWGHELKALNAKLTNGSKCQADCSKCRTDDMMALDAKLTNGSECLTMNDDSERQTMKKWWL